MLTGLASRAGVGQGWAAAMRTHAHTRNSLGFTNAPLVSKQATAMPETMSCVCFSCCRSLTGLRGMFPAARDIGWVPPDKRMGEMAVLIVDGRTENRDRMALQYQIRS